MAFSFFTLPLALIIGLVLLALAGKSEPDPTRERPTALYFSVVTLIGVLLLLAAAWLTANGLVELTDTKPTHAFSGNRIEIRGDSVFSSNYGAQVNHDDDISQVIGGLIAGAIAAGILWFHLPKLEQDADDSTGPGARVYARVLYFIWGAALIVGLAAAGATVFSVYGLIAPDTAGVGAATDALRTLLSSGAVAAAAGYIFLRAWKRSEDLAAIVRPPAAPATEQSE
jgi:hypothetical protein